MPIVELDDIDVDKGNDFNICKLFPSPVYLAGYEKEFTQEEINYVVNMERRFVSGNSVSKEMYVLKDSVFKNISAFITYHLNNFFNVYYDPVTDVKLRITQSWIAYTEPGEYHHKHDHKNSVISGVLYLNADRNNDRITLHKFNEPFFDLISKNVNNYNSNMYMFPTGTGDLILFPSHLQHEVNSFSTANNQHTRVSLAFNSFFEGEIGDYEHATQLKV